MPPEDLVKILNRYLGLAVHEIFEQDGTLDKFLGDAIMAIFNAPVRQPDHVERALRAAVAIKERVQELWNELPQEFQLSFGIGVNVGEAIVGNIGSDKRMDYTAIGDSVNVAETPRRAGASWPDTDQPGSTGTRQRLDRGAITPIDVHAAGRQTHMLVYELLDVHPASHRDD